MTLMGKPLPSLCSSPPWLTNILELAEDIKRGLFLYSIHPLQPESIINHARFSEWIQGYTEDLNITTRNWCGDGIYDNFSKEVHSTLLIINIKLKQILQLEDMWMCHSHEHSTANIMKLIDDLSSKRRTLHRNVVVRC